MPAERPPLWVCPACGRAFANIHQSHACGPLDLTHHLAGRSDAVKATYAAFLALLEENGPVSVLPEKPGRVPGADTSFGRSSPSCWAASTWTC